MKNPITGISPMLIARAAVQAEYMESVTSFMRKVVLQQTSWTQEKASRRPTMKHTNTWPLKSEKLRYFVEINENDTGGLFLGQKHMLQYLTPSLWKPRPSARILGVSKTVRRWMLLLWQSLIYTHFVAHSAIQIFGTIRTCKFVRILHLYMSYMSMEISILCSTILTNFSLIYWNLLWNIRQTKKQFIKVVSSLYALLKDAEALLGKGPIWISIGRLFVRAKHSIDPLDEILVLNFGNLFHAGQSLTCVRSTSDVHFSRKI